MTTLKIAHVVRRFAFDEWGGTESVVWNTALQQSAMGLVPEILATAALATTGEELRQGIRICRFPYWYPYFPMTDVTRLALDKKGGNPFSPKLFQALRNGGYSLIHIHCGGRLAVQCALTAKRLGIPSVISLHGGHAKVPPEELQKMLAPTHGKFHYGGLIDRMAGLRKDALAEVSAIICLSHAERSALEERLPNQRIVYLPNGVNCQEFQTKPSISPRTEWGISPERRLMLCISRIDYQKNQLILLEALAKLADTHLLLVGPITSQTYYEQLIQRARELDVTSRLTVIPGLPSDDPRLKAILHEAEVFVFPSLHEPFGIVALEAWAAGLPVVAARVGGLPDFIVHERNGLLFNPKDGTELTAQITRLLTDNNLRNTLVTNALADVNDFSWTNLSKRLVTLYHELLNA